MWEKHKWNDKSCQCVGTLIIYILNQSQWIFIKNNKTISNRFPIPLIPAHAQSDGFPISRSSVYAYRYTLIRDHAPVFHFLVSSNYGEMYGKFRGYVLPF